MSIAIAIGFVFLILFILGGPWAQGPQAASLRIKRMRNKANGNGNAHANVDWYFLVLFFKMVRPHLAWPHLAFSKRNLCGRDFKKL